MNPDHTLDVWLDQRHVGEFVALRRDHLRFTYSRDIVQEQGLGSLCLSTSLPVRAAAFSTAAATSWFEALLPDDPMRGALERRFGVRRGDTFGLLAHIGAECAGAVAVVGHGSVPPHDGWDYAPITNDELGSLLTELPVQPLGISDDVRLSLAGAQQKLLVTSYERKPGEIEWSLPLNGAPTTHILKPEPPEFPGLVHLEAFGLSLARRVLEGTSQQASAVSASNEELAGRRVLVVTRYDRAEDAAGVHRVHQEDAGQALGLPATTKYVGDPGSPTLAGLAAILRAHSADPLDSLKALLAAVIVQWVVGNADAHIRNYSLIHQQGAVRLAPLYDVAPTIAFPQVSTTLALHVGAAETMREITVAELQAEANSWGLPRSSFDAVLMRAATNLQSHAIDVAPEGIPTHVLDHVAKVSELLAAHALGR